MLLISRPSDFLQYTEQASQNRFARKKDYRYKALSPIRICYISFYSSTPPNPPAKPTTATIMQLSLFSLFLLMFSGLSIGIGLPHQICLDTLQSIGVKAEKELWPIINQEVCQKGKKPSTDDFGFAEKEIIAPLFTQLAKRGLKVPPYKEQIKATVREIVKDCVRKQNINFCVENDNKKVKACVVDKSLEFIMGHLDLSDKYGDEANCRKLKEIVSEEGIWSWAKGVVKRFAKYVT
jgi:hypothetical protein